MKMTMIQLVQNIMSSMDSDEIDSITDTVEGEQVAREIYNTYWLLVQNRTIPEHRSLFQLTDAGSTNKVFMLIPTTVGEIDWIKYNVIADGDENNQFANIPYNSPEEFMDKILSRQNSEDNIVSATDPNSTLVLDAIQNDKRPEFWTTFDDEYICFDSYNSEVDSSGLVASKTMCHGVIIPTFTVTNSLTDAFIPDLDDNLFPLLLTEAKSTCFVNLKQTVNAKIEKQSRDQKVFSQNDRNRTLQAEKASSGATGPDFGRRRR